MFWLVVMMVSFFGADKIFKLKLAKCNVLMAIEKKNDMLVFDPPAPIHFVP